MAKHGTSVLRHRDAPCASAEAQARLAPMHELVGKVADAFAESVREHEAAWLSPLAVRSYETRGRNLPEEECRLRTPFQRDRDRIVHSKAFRRLRHKTQVFVDPEGDHFRTRLTHTIEAAGIARTVARALRLNEDLVEAIGLGHDLGHPPFGHAGEQALDEVLRERGGRGFRHNEHSLRVVERLERDGRGLNLTWEVRDGILKHTGDEEPETQEGRIVRIVDRVAYINHDIDDAIRAGWLAPGDLPRDEIAILGETGSRRIDTLVHDLVEQSAVAGDIVQSEEVGGAMLALRAFMFDRVYLGAHVAEEHARIRATVRRIFDHLVDGPGDDLERATDYLAGMTDRFALAFAAELD
jgi:dGTPase